MLDADVIVVVAVGLVDVVGSGGAGLESEADSEKRSDVECDRWKLEVVSMAEATVNVEPVISWSVSDCSGWPVGGGWIGWRRRTPAAAPRTPDWTGRRTGSPRLAKLANNLSSSLASLASSDVAPFAWLWRSSVFL